MGQDACTPHGPERRREGLVDAGHAITILVSAAHLTVSVDNLGKRSESVGGRALPESEILARRAKSPGGQRVCAHHSLQTRTGTWETRPWQ